MPSSQIQGTDSTGTPVSLEEMTAEFKYREIPAHVYFPELEEQVLEEWERSRVFHRTLEKTASGPRWVCYEGPPTANGAPGAHHVEARVFKDVFPRYRTMRGYHVPRRAGWDCHGLPVELAVERRLGFTGKRDIESFGIAEFNRQCRESVLEQVDKFAEMTRRMGYWVDLDEAYWTMAPDYIESVWWSLKVIFDAGLLAEDHRVAPYCPRCGTGLSEHEVAQGYEDVVDPSVYVRFPVAAGALADEFPGLALLVWTTTPWTLVSNTAVAVHPNAEYLVARTRAGENVVVAAELAGSVLGEGFEVLRRGLSGTELERLRYLRPFDLVDIPDSHYVVLGEYVTTDDGTGLVHLAPAFGADDLAVCRRYGLPVVNPVLADGTFANAVGLVGGLFFKDADQSLVADLKARGRLFAEQAYPHAYPHCWRCHTPLLYYAQPSWYIRTTALADRLLAANESTNWFPETIKWGRFGDWLRNNVDWALSRNRYWGTPLPIWRCPEAHLTCVGSLTELGELVGRDLDALDPHRPFVDEIAFACPTCGNTATRVPEVIDCWYDSGAMPFAQWGYPHRNSDQFSGQYPADFICEAIDQTRGWFYTLMAVGVLVFDESAYRDVLCLGHILDAEGRKMSKHLGNVLEPIPLMDAHGADALRWFMLANGSPWQARRVSHDAIKEAVRKTLPTLWNTASFLSLYGRIAEFDPADPDVPAPSQRPSLDRWALTRLHELIIQVTAALDEYDTARAGRLLTDFLDDLSNWYVRRSRRRFWDGDRAALATLHECIRSTLGLMAPFTPFVTERLWRDLVVAVDPAATDSVHLSDWPVADPDLVDRQLLHQVELLRDLVELGRTARATSKIKTRQPLRRGLVAASGWDRLPADLICELSTELNVLSVEPLQSDAQELVDVTVKAQFRNLGRRFGRRTPAVAAAIAASDPVRLRDELANSGRARLLVAGNVVEVEPDDVVITEVPRIGWSVATASGQTIALDLAIDDELRILGVTRDVVRFVQQTRKNLGLEVTDRIELRWSATGAAAAALREHETAIAAEVLAVRVIPIEDMTPDAVEPELGLAIGISRCAATAVRTDLDLG